MDKVVGQLLNSDEPSVRLKIWVHLLDKDLESDEIQQLQQEIKASSRVHRLLSERDQDALDLLGTKRLPDGGFPAEKKYYRVTDRRGSGRSPVNWGGTRKKRMNEFVTADALTVLRAAGRLDAVVGQ